MMQHVNDSEYSMAKMLFDGDETLFYTFKFNLEVENQSVEIKASDFYDNSLEKLSFEVKEEEFQEVLLRGKFERRVYLVETYLGTEFLPVYYCFKNLLPANEQYLIIFSFKEIQPTRFRLYLEDIWKK